jgi:hypothetical protein
MNIYFTKIILAVKSETEGDVVRGGQKECSLDEEGKSGS